AIFVKYILLVQRFTAAVFHVGFPCSTDLLNHAVWQAGVIQIGSLFAAIFICPVEELQHFSTLLRLLLLFVDQNEGGRRDRPCIVAFLVGQVLREGFAPVSAFRGVGEVLFGRANRFAVGRNQFGVSQVVLLSVSVFYVTDGAWQTLYEGCDTVVAFTAQTGWPVNGRAGTDFRFPLFVHFRQVAGEHERGTRAVSTTNHRDILRRQLNARVQLSDGFVIPFFDFAQVDVTQGFAVQHQLA